MLMTHLFPIFLKLKAIKGDQDSWWNSAKHCTFHALCLILYMLRYSKETCFFVYFITCPFFKLPVRVWSAVQDELKASRDGRARLIFVKISDNIFQEAGKQTWHIYTTSNMESVRSIKLAMTRTPNGNLPLSVLPPCTHLVIMSI